MKPNTALVLFLTGLAGCGVSEPEPPPDPEPDPPVVTDISIYTRSYRVSPTSAGLSVEVPWVLSPRQSLKMTVSYYDQYGQTMDPVPLDWSSADDAVATVSSDGIVTAVAPGFVRIRAAAGLIFSTSPVHVSYLVASVLLAPDSLVLNPGDTAPIAATVLDVEGAIVPQADRNLDWVSGDELVATVDSGGRVTATGTGTTLITATARWTCYATYDSVAGVFPPCQLSAGISARVR